MGQITATRNLVATKVVRHAGQLCCLHDLKFSVHLCLRMCACVRNMIAVVRFCIVNGSIMMYRFCCLLGMLLVSLIPNYQVHIMI